MLKILSAKGKITKEMNTLLSTWRHSGFHAFCGNRIWPEDVTGMENLARYIIRTSFSQARMQYLDQEGKVVYAAKSSAGQETEGGNTLSIVNPHLTQYPMPLAW